MVSGFERLRKIEGRVWAKGYTRGELDDAQEKFNLTFPPDMVALFLERRPVNAWDWRSDEKHIRRMLEWPFQGLLFDVENCGLWWPDWGERPALLGKRAEILRSVLQQSPKLAPLLSHRYIPCEPNEVGNPAFSIYQSDVIYYGVNLADYFEREFGNAAAAPLPAKHIRFWSDLVDRAFQDSFYPGRKAPAGVNANRGNDAGGGGTD
jgi:hypothetical protein